MNSEEIIITPEAMEQVDSWMDEPDLRPVRTNFTGIIRNAHIYEPLEITNNATGKTRQEYSADIAFDELRLADCIDWSTEIVCKRRWGEKPQELSSLVRPGAEKGYPEKYYVHISSIYKPSINKNKTISDGDEVFVKVSLKGYEGKYKRAVVANMLSFE